MARINNTNRYPFDTNVTVEDFLIGSDAEISPDGKYLKTKNYKIGDIISLVPTENTDSFNYGYRYSNTVDVNTNPAYFTITGSDEQIENITSLTFNKVNSEGKDISDFFTSITGNESNIVFNITDGTEDNFGFFKPVAVTNPTTDTFNVTVTPIGSLQKGSLTEGQIYTSTFAVNGASGAGSTDYVSNVAFDGSNLNFTGVGNAFGSSVDLSSLDNNNYISNVNFNTSTNNLEFTGVGSGFNGNESLASLLNPWDNIDGTPANQSSTDINHNGGNVGIGLAVSTTPDADLHIKSNSVTVTDLILQTELQTGEISLKVDNNGSVWNSGKTGTVGNTFFGFDSGTPTSFSCSFFGFRTGVVNSTGNNNSFFGTSSGSDNTTGSGNSFFGDLSGTNNTIGNNNSFFGSKAGKDNIGGFFNSFYGYFSGSSNTSGQFNTFYGGNSGLNNVDGNNNTFLGFQSSDFFTTGSNNISIGANAARQDSLLVNLTSANQSIFLGNNTKPLANGGTNEVVIGYNAVGNGSNTITLGNTSNVRTYNKGVNNVSNAYTVTTLPTGVRGDVAYVTDANFISYRATASGGGSDTALVFFDGTNWIYH